MKNKVNFIIVSLLCYFIVFITLRLILGYCSFFHGYIEEEIYIHIGLLVIYIGICTQYIISEINNHRNDK